MKEHKKLTEKERDQLAIWKAQGVSNKECAKRLGRHPSTIGRELARNGFDKYYVAIHAQRLASDRQKKSAHGKKPLKDPDIYKYVTEHLRAGWSPDQISGRLKTAHPDQTISTEAIYRWIYHPEQCEDRWWEYLRRKQKKRKKKQGRKVHSSRIPDRVSIHARDAKINERIEFGHWEGDTVEGKGRSHGVHTEVERKSRFILAQKVSAITSDATIAIQKQLFEKVPTVARKSTTLDNGRENHHHSQLKEIGMRTFFADPYSSWQRGTNEHGNWHIRYYFPKGTDFTKVTGEELQDVLNEINNRPRKILQYRTAREMFHQLLKEEAGVAINS